MHFFASWSSDWISESSRDVQERAPIDQISLVAVIIIVVVVFGGGGCGGGGVVGGAHVVLEEFGHAEALELFDADDFEELVVTFGELLVLGILEVVLLDIGPHLLDDFVPGANVLAHDGCEIFGQFLRFRESTASSST